MGMTRRLLLTRTVSWGDWLAIVLRPTRSRLAVSVLSGKSQNPSSALQQLKDCDAQVRAVLLLRGTQFSALIYARFVM